MEFNIEQEQQQLESIVADALETAKKRGATQAEVAISRQTGISATTRLQQVETLEFNHDGALGLTVYFGKRKGNASTADLRPEAIREALDAACNIAKYTSDDNCNGPANAELMPQALPDLSLFHPGDLSAEAAVEKAMCCEQAGMEHASQITNSDGATYNSHYGVRVYGNSHGFVVGYPSSRHSLSCVLIGEGEDEMQRDYSYSVSRVTERLWTPERVGIDAAKRTLGRLGARKIKTCKVPVLLSADLAGGFFGHFVGAISGGNLYRNASFLKDKLGESIFPEFISIAERPHIPTALASAPFDSEGVATQDRKIIDQGILQTYLLTSYSARKLGMANTGHAGGIFNWLVRHSDQDLQGMLKTLGTGLYVTELMGQGVNLVTGDYSRGAAGFWVENGEIQYPVHEITIAGNLKDMFANLVMVGCDLERRGQIQTGSILFSDLQVAGN